MNSTQLDDFYRLFLIPGMGHCVNGAGSPDFGQDGSAVSTAEGASNVLDDIVNWVENGVAPDVVVGASTDGTALRTHCRYPQRSVYNGTEYVCDANINT